MPGTTPPDNTSGGQNGAETPSANPQLAAARFYNPRGLTFDAAGNLYVVDRINLPNNIDSRGHDIVSKITPAGAITHLGSSGYELDGLATDPTGNVYYAETRYDWIMKLDPTGSKSVFASSNGSGGIAIDAVSFRPKAIASDMHGNVYIADTGNRLIRKIATDGTVTTLAGQTSGMGMPSTAVDGDAPDARFARPVGIAVDRAGDVYVLDLLSERYYDSDRGESVSALTLVRKIDVSTGAVITVAGWPQSWGQSDDRGLHGSWGPSDAAGLPPRFTNATGIDVDAAGNIYVTDQGHAAVRKVSPDGTVSTIAGGPGGNFFRSPADVAVAVNGDLYVTDSVRYVIYKVTQGGQVTVFAGKEDDHGRVAWP